MPSTDLGWVTIPTEEFERLHAVIRRMKVALEWVRDDTELWDAPIVLEALREVEQL